MPFYRFDVRTCLYVVRSAVTSFMLVATTATATSQEAVPPPPGNVLAAKAYTALDTGCAGCHQAGRAAALSAGGLTNVLALDDIAASPWLVQPGSPDASRLYNIALTWERHEDILNDPATPGLGPDDVQAIRDWISDLPTRDVAECRPAGHEAAGIAMEHVASVLARLAPETSRLTRFVSLAHLGGSCGPASDIARLQGTLAARHTSGPTGSRPTFQPVDPQRRIWQFSLRDVSTSPTDWDALVGLYGQAAASASPQAAWIAQASGSSAPVGPADLFLASEAGGRDAGAIRIWNRPAAMGRFAAELGLSHDNLGDRLTGLPPIATLPGRLLLSGATARRQDLDRIARLLSGSTAKPDPPAGGGENAPAEIALWSDKRTYREGEVVTFSVTANRDCFVTLVGVDRAGRATVLYPNEFEPNNKLLRGAVLTVPSADAGFRFRFKEKGAETIVAICSANHAAPAGVAHDYERLRFTVLGDWQLFLREPPEMREARRDDAAGDTPRPQIVQRKRGRSPATKTEPTVPSFDDQVRTAIRIVIE